MEKDLFVVGCIGSQHGTVDAAFLEIDKEGHEAMSVRFMPVDKELILNRRKLGRINKPGDAYLRTLLTHGARATLWHAKKTNDPDRLRA